MSLHPPGPHGGDAARLASTLGVDGSEVLDLSASMNPLAPDWRPVVERALDSLSVYPDDSDATAALADTIGVDADRLLLTNGGAEAIALVAEQHPTGWADPFEFSLYRRHLRTVERHAPVWRSDPHNPTGRLLASDLHSAVRDEAFYVLATGRWTRGDERTTVVGSLTKAFALPGLRIGYVLTPEPEDAHLLRRRRPEWSVNALACAVVPALLAMAEPESWVAGIATLRAELVDLLGSHGLEPEPSDVNYVWIPDAGDLRERLLPHGVLVRDGSSFGAPGAVRVAVPGPAGLARLASALDAAAHEFPPSSPTEHP